MADPKEYDIQLDQKDIDRMRRINLDFKVAQEAWDKAMKLILFDYVEIKNSNVKLSMKHMDFNTGKLKINVQENPMEVNP